MIAHVFSMTWMINLAISSSMRKFKTVVPVESLSYIREILVFYVLKAFDDILFTSRDQTAKPVFTFSDS